MARDTDEPDKALVSRLDGRLESPVFAQRKLPLDHIDEVVQLDQVDVVDTQPVERAPYFLPRFSVFPLAGLCRHEELSRVALQPRRNPQLRAAVRRGGIDVVHTDRDRIEEPRVALFCPPCAAAEYGLRPDVAAADVCLWEPRPGSEPISP